MNSKVQEFKRLRKKIDLQSSQDLEILIKQAWEKARAAAELIKKDFSASKVILYGSLVADRFKEGSDIDLLVVGFKGSFWTMLVQVEEIASPVPVSVVCQEDANESLIYDAYEKGVVL